MKQLLKDQNFKEIPIKLRNLNTKPIFTKSLDSLQVSECQTISYLLPSVYDAENNNNYSIIATQYNDASLLLTWISFDSRKFVISPPKGSASNQNNDIKIRIIDSNGAYSDYELSLLVLSSANLSLNLVHNITLVSPQNFLIIYSDILSSNYNYDLKDSISLVSIDCSTIPYYVAQNVSEYSLIVSSNFTVDKTIQVNYKFKVIDYCGDEHYTNVFTLTIYPNKPPVVQSSIANSSFYEGQLFGVIPFSNNLFSDPGDKIKFGCIYIN